MAIKAEGPPKDAVLRASNIMRTGRFEFIGNMKNCIDFPAYSAYSVGSAAKKY